MDYERWIDGKVATIDTAMTEADFSGKNLGASGAQILAAFMSTKLFGASGSLSKLTFCGNGGRTGGRITGGAGDPVTIDTTMTEADFSGAKLGVSGAIIVSAFIRKW